MQREPINSGAVLSAGYDKKDHVAEFELRGGGVWRYHGVAPSDWRAFLDAPSKGAFFNSVIKQHHATPVEQHGE
jgi:hypothetical protein